MARPALIVLTGVWALIRAREERTNGADSAWPWLLHGAALALLPWLHTRFALLAGSIGALVLLDLARTRNPAGKATAFLDRAERQRARVDGVLHRDLWRARSVDPVPRLRPRVAAYIAGGLGGLFFDQMYGLFANAPVLMAASRRDALCSRWRRGPYRLLPAQSRSSRCRTSLTVTHFAMWWGGYSSPARFLVPLLPSFAIPAPPRRGPRRASRMRPRVLWRARWSSPAASRPCSRSSIAAVWRISIAATSTRCGPSGPAGPPIWRTALPAYFARVQRQRPGGLFYLEIAVWLAAIAAACLALSRDRRRCGAGCRREPGRGACATVAGALLAAAVMVRG